MDRTVLRTKKVVPISCFDEGGASRIFDVVEHDGPTVVMNNDHPVCVLLSPKQYEAMLEMLSDTLLLEKAESRMAMNDDTKNIRQEEIMRTLGINQEELDAIDVEIS
jgi:PHD/YefM family antitoxin component YafN of YafNO toxin-antitoxin module